MDLRHGYPYSLVRSGLPCDYPKLQNHASTEVIVIGSGISGALSAFYLTQAGIPCIVLDGRTVGLGSTCASTSLIQYELDKPLVALARLKGIENASRVYQLCSEAIDELESVCKEIRFDKFQRRKSVYYAALARHANLLESEFKLRKNCGLHVQLLDKDSLSKAYGLRKKAAIVSEQGACMDAYVFTHALHQYNINKGCRVFDRSPVIDTEYLRNGVRVVTKNGYSVKGRWIINAMGYEAEALIGPKFVKLHSTYAVASEQVRPMPATPFDKTIFWSTGNPYLYFRKTADNRFIIGGRDEDYYNPALRDSLLKPKAAQLAGDFRRLFPDIEFLPEFAWTGTFGSTSDSLPYIGSHERFPHTLFALGFGGNGIVFSVIAARLNTRTILCEKDPDQSLFGFERA